MDRTISIISQFIACLSGAFVLLTAVRQWMANDWVLLAFAALLSGGLAYINNKKGQIK